MNLLFVAFFLVAVNASCEVVSDPASSDFGGTLCTAVVKASKVVPRMPTGVGIPVPPQVRTFTSLIRGFRFTAPVDFVITGLDIPTDASSALGRAVILRSTSGPWAEFSLETTSAGYEVLADLSDIPIGGVALSIPITTGDIIGVLGFRGSINSYTSDTGPFNSNIDGTPVVLDRFLSQSNPTGNPVFSSPVSTEFVGPLSRVEVFVNGNVISVE